MSTKDSYTAEEWALVSGAPVLAGSYIALSDPGVTSLIGETSAMMKAITSGEVPAGAKDLVDSIIAGMKQMAESGEKVEMPKLSDDDGNDPAAAKVAMLEKIKAASDAVSAKGAAGEAAAYQQWVLSIANATAEAAKEGGFLGIGGKRVSDVEKAALAEISAALTA